MKKNAIDEQEEQEQEEPVTIQEMLLGEFSALEQLLEKHMPSGRKKSNAINFVQEASAIVEEMDEELFVEE